MTPHRRSLQPGQLHLRPPIARDEDVPAPVDIDRSHAEWECPLEPGRDYGVTSATGPVQILPPPC